MSRLWTLGCNLAAQNRLQSNSVSNINETILSSINETIQRIDDPKVEIEPIFVMIRIHWRKDQKL